MVTGNQYDPAKPMLDRRHRTSVVQMIYRFICEKRSSTHCARWLHGRGVALLRWSGETVRKVVLMRAAEGPIAIWDGEPRRSSLDHDSGSRRAVIRQERGSLRRQRCMDCAGAVAATRCMSGRGSNGACYVPTALGFTPLSGGHRDIHVSRSQCQQGCGVGVEGLGDPAWTLEILPGELRDLQRSWEYFRRSDLHKLSAVDATSFAIMKRVRIRLAYTFDHHFAVVGFRIVT